MLHRGSELLNDQSVLDPRPCQAALDAGRRQQAFRIEQQIVSVNRDAGRGIHFDEPFELEPEEIEDAL